MIIVIDGRDLQPPEPMERTVEALDRLGADDEILLLLYCQPHPLFNVLRNNGYAWTDNLLPDGTREIHIRRQPG
jgi:hypothetical protein